MPIFPGLMGEGATKSMVLTGGMVLVVVILPSLSTVSYGSTHILESITPLYD
jgi:hypothetical protein